MRQVIGVARRGKTGIVGADERERSGGGWELCIVEESGFCPVPGRAVHCFVGAADGDGGGGLGIV
jgi:hypothetical protein